MPKDIKLFSSSRLFGVFKGFSGKGLEFAAELVVPYDANMLERPQLGQFLLVELGGSTEASLGRVTKFHPAGMLTLPEGEDYLNTVQTRGNQVPEDLKKQKLKYRVQIKLLGAIRADNGKMIYVPSHRRLPQLGAKVALPSKKVMRALCSLSEGKTELGNYALGEFVYANPNSDLGAPFLRHMEPELKVHFDVNNLVSKRSVVFARAGYGKSNLMKLLIAELYKTQPMTDSANPLPVGMLIFDPEGEYFWPDVARGRPGLCDVPQVSENLSVFTNRVPPNPHYDKWKVGGLKLDIRNLPPSDVLSIDLSSERQDQQNVIKLKSVRRDNWPKLVDLLYEQGLQASDVEIGNLMGYNEKQISTSMMEIAAARSNLNNVVRTLHDPNSRLLEGTVMALRKGGIVVVDISLLSAGGGSIMSGLLLQHIFGENQKNFTGGDKEKPIIPVVAVLEEAQSFLGKNLNDQSPFVEWVKEGRKYELGAILVTQQPGSLASELLSQADNWFVFHLLSEGDAYVLSKHNSHFSHDVLAHLIGEPIAGNCYFWAAPKQPFVLPVRIRNFEQDYSASIGKTSAGENSLATEITEQLEVGTANVMAKLRSRLNQINWQKCTGHKDKYRIKKGRIYFLLKDVAPDWTDQQINNERDALMAGIYPGVENKGFKDNQGKLVDFYVVSGEELKKAKEEEKDE